MNAVVFHIVSGHSFFTGVALILIAVWASVQDRPVYRRVTALSFVIGVIAVFVSSTPIPYWWYAVAATASMVWMASYYKTSWRRWAACCAAVSWVIAATMELPYHITPTLSSAAERRITIIGDSVTAGVGGDEKSETWPSILGRDHDLKVQDISHVGETAASALKRAKSHTIDGCVVFVEIGGNDILGSTTAEQFATDLEGLLSYLAAADRQVVMLELPLPPLFHEFGRVQRTVAAKHDVVLIPKRVFLSVLAGGDSTLDSIHLSQAGHERMAICVWRLIENAFATNGT